MVNMNKAKATIFEITVMVSAEYCSLSILKIC